MQKRYIIEMSIAEVDENGDSVDTVEYSRSLFATTNLVGLRYLFGVLENFNESVMQKFNDTSPRDKEN